jgi:ABC-type phosphate/phosphonate transport system substrate-binding protein
VSPAALLTSADLAKAVPLVCSVRQGLSAYHGCLYVKSDSKIRSPAELAQCRAAWVAPSSAAGFIFPRLALASYGFDPRSLFSEESYHGSHGRVAEAVLGGRADVGAGYAVFENGNPTSELVRAPFLDHPTAQGRILLATSPIPSDLIVAASSLSAVLRAQLTRALQELGDAEACRAALAHVLGAEGFVRHSPDALATLREQIDVGHRLELLDDGTPA